MKVKKLNLATNIKIRRTALGLSLEALAQRCGVSRAMLSEVERETKSPTIGLVCQIAEGLGCSVSQLLGEEPADLPPLWQVLRQAERQTLVDKLTGVERQLLAPAMLRQGLEIVWYTLPPGQKTGLFPPHQAGVVEHITVVQGQLFCRLDEQELKLDPGDSLFFQANITHEFSNPASEFCHYFLVIDSSQKPANQR